MSVDRDPREGDEFRWHETSAACLVDEVTPKGLVIYNREPGGYLYARPVDYWRKYATLVVPRPKVADCWGWLGDKGQFWTALDEPEARTAVARYAYRTLARIIGGRICDEHGEPFEAAT